MNSWSMQEQLRKPSFILAAIVAVFAVVCALYPSTVVGQSGLLGVTADRLQSPSAAHLFGTDQLGRDLFARTVYGASLSISSALLAVGVGLVFGCMFGLIAGFAGGMTDAIIMRIIDVVLSIPSLLLSLSIITALGTGTINVAVAVGISAIAIFTRVMRSEVIRVKLEPFIEAAHAAGVSNSSILIRHVLPNSSNPILSLAALEIGAAILSISSLSFLGFGAPPPTPEWGSLVAQGRDHLATAWWLITMPGLVIVAVALSANRISRAIASNRPSGM